MVVEDYFGFYLGNTFDESETVLCRVASFKGRGNCREVVEVRPKNESFKAPHGELIQFETEAEELNSDAVCTFKRLPKKMYVHETTDDGIVHTAENIDVSAANCTASGEFQHVELGPMIDKKNLMFPGSYRSISFKVVVQNKTFRLEVVQAIRLEDAQTSQQPDVVEELTQRFKELGNVLKVEMDHVTASENKNWLEIGPLKLVKFDNSTFFTGSRPIFELVEKNNVELLQHMPDGARISIIKLKFNTENNLWEDVKKDDDNAPKGSFFRVDNEETLCSASLSLDFRFFIDEHMQVGDVFRFESSQSLDDINYWQNERHEECDIFKLTKDGEEADCNLQDVLESHMAETDAMKKLRDRGHERGILNESQWRAVMMARNEDRKLVCIQGPPGTGKTFVLANYLCTLISEGKSAVVMTPTKEAMVNIQKKTRDMLVASKIPFHRNTLMNIWRFQRRLEESEVSEDVASTIESWKADVTKKTLSKKDYRQLVKKLVGNLKLERCEIIMEHTKIVFATVASTFTKMLMKTKFFNPEVCVIDEASQVMEAQTWPACCRMKRIVMAGDPKQLPAIVFSEEARKFELNSSVMDRIIKDKDRFSWIMLNEQYRCHPMINKWSNESFYHGSLKTAVRVGQLTEKFTVPPAKKWEAIYAPFVLIDTSLERDEAKRILTFEEGVSHNTSVEKGNNGYTYQNRGEAEIVIEHYKKLVEFGIPSEGIAIITPYKGQLELVNMRMDELNIEKCQIGTVDSFQGQEYEAVIFSMVRSNPKLHLGFVADLRRLNVAITRAKKHFCLVGNGFMLHKSRTSEIKQLFSLLQERRFPPSYVSHVSQWYDMKKVTNNFGLNFSLFLEHTKDEDMKQYCRDYIKKSAEYQLERRKRYTQRNVV